MKFEIFVVLILCFFRVNAFFAEPRINPHAEVTEECSNYAARGSCEFYRCLEERFPCGHSGFALRYGLHVCDRYYNSRLTFNELGQRWINSSSRCLTSRLLPVYNAYASRCGDIRDAGVDAMLLCNDRRETDGTDFCTFVSENYQSYRNVMRNEEISRIVRLRSPRLVTEMMRQAVRCGRNQVESRINTGLARIEMFFDSVATVVTDRWNSFWS